MSDVASGMDWYAKRYRLTAVAQSCLNSAYTPALNAYRTLNPGGHALSIASVVTRSHSPS